MIDGKMVFRILRRPKTHALVMARYNEDIDWISEIPDCFDIHIYDKGSQPTPQALPESVKSYVKRPNIGREAETYLFHLRSAPPRRDSFTVFSQADPFEHSPDFLRLLQAHRSWRPVQPLSYLWRPDRKIPPPHVLSIDPGIRLHDARVRLESYSLATWEPLRFSDEGARFVGKRYREIHDLAEGTNLAEHFLRRLGLHGAARRASEHLIGAFCYGGIFAVDGRILNRFSRADFGRMHEVAMEENLHAYLLERLWMHLFGLDFFLPARRIHDRR